MTDTSRVAYQKVAELMADTPREGLERLAEAVQTGQLIPDWSPTDRADLIAALEALLTEQAVAS